MQAAQARVDATVAAYQAFYAREGKPHPVTFPSDEQMEQERRAVRAIMRPSGQRTTAR